MSLVPIEDKYLKPNISLRKFSYQKQIIEIEAMSVNKSIDYN